MTGILIVIGIILFFYLAAKVDNWHRQKQFDDFAERDKQYEKDCFSRLEPEKTRLQKILETADNNTLVILREEYLFQMKQSFNYSKPTSRYGYVRQHCWSDHCEQMLNLVEKKIKESR